MRSLIVIAALLYSAVGLCADVRLKEIARFSNNRDLSLTGYGIVVGLAGTGDSVRHAPTVQSLSNALRNFGVDVPKQQLNSRNAASVMVTATIPAFAEPGDTFDVTVSSMGDARSLHGGALLLLPLELPSGDMVALAQGSVSVGGFEFGDANNTVRRNHPTVGIVSDGGRVESRLGGNDFNSQQFELVLKDPDITTASNVESAINRAYGQPLASAKSAARIVVAFPADTSNKIQFLSSIERVRVETDQRARVIINERTGTIVAGADIAINRASIVHGNLRLTISSELEYLGPNPVVISDSNVGYLANQVDVAAEEKDSKLLTLNEGAKLDDLMAALKRLSFSTRDMINVLQALERAGALHAEVVVQ